MPIQKDYVIYTYSDEEQGQVPVSTVTSPWVNLEGASEVTLSGAFAGGTTTLEIEQSKDGVTVDAAKTAIAVAGLTDGIAHKVAYKFVRFKIVQTVATTTNAELSVKVTD